MTDSEDNNRESTPSFQPPKGAKRNKPQASQIETLITGGFDLIPLRVQSKAPRDKGWTNKKYEPKSVLTHMKRGGNVGVRLRKCDLVVDVDPRNGGDASFARLCADFGIKLEDYPVVRTGSGGLHVYMSKPEDMRCRSKLNSYLGIDIKSEGSQVVAPGSVHPNGGLYSWQDNEGDIWLGVREAPGELLGAISCETSATSENVDAAVFEPEQVASMLEALDPCEFRDHEDWLQLMMACHHASGGDARTEFVEWSTSDPAYSDHSEKIADRWGSLRTDQKGSVTYKTLFRILHEHGAGDAIPPLTSPEEDFAEPVGELNLPLALESKPETTSEPVPLEDNKPMTIAGAMLEGRPLIRSNGEWFHYNKRKNHYVPLEDERFTSMCWKWADGRLYVDHSRGEPVKKRLVATNRLIANVEAAARSLRQVPRTAPAWVKERPDDPDASELLVCANGLLHLPTRQLRAPTKRLFAVNGSPVSYDPNAPKPTRWLKFLDELFPEEKDCIKTLQEATGYFLTQDTSLQKIIQFVGPPRAGKGVYTRVLQSLIGEGNYTSPTAKKLSGQFGLQPLLGKQLAVISDMRTGKHTDLGTLTETLLTVSGEDSVSVPRKYKDNWEGKLNARFLIISNEMLQLRDTSDALGARMILIVTRQSFLGKEDEGLTKKLQAELPGILNWALDGLDRLRERRYFEQPPSCHDEVMQMHRLTSPVKSFLENEVVCGPEFEVEKDRLWDAFSEWVYEEGLRYSGEKAHFIKDLKSASAQFTETRPGKSKSRNRKRVLVGLEPKADFLERIHREAVADFNGVEI